MLRENFLVFATVTFDVLLLSKFTMILNSKYMFKPRLFEVRKQREYL